MVSQGRVERIARRIQEELSEMMLFEIGDPRLSGVYITHVRVDRELAFASIFVSALEGAERSPEILDSLERAAGYLRHQLSQRVQLRSFPKLRFNWDPIPEEAARMDKLIDSLNTGEQEDDREDS